MPSVGSLSTSLTLESQQFVVGLKRAADQAAASGKKIEGHLNAIRRVGSVMAGGVVTSAIVAAGKRALEYASSLGEVAQQLGVTTRELQVYRYAGSQAGIATDQMDTALGKLTRTVGEAKAGNKAQAIAFRELGVSIQDANGKVYTAGELMPRLADAFSKIKDPATRARLEVDLFGKSGQKLDTLLAGGRGALDELTNAAERLGIVLSDEQIQKADETADKLAQLKTVLEANMAGAIADNADAILGLADALAQVVVWSGKAVNALTRWHDANVEKILTFRANFLGDKDAAAAVEGMKQKRRDASLTAGRRLFGGVAPSGGTPDGDLPAVRSSGGGRSRAPSGPTDADREANFQSELSRLIADQLDGQQRLATSIEERAALEHDRIEASADSYAMELDEQIAEKKITDAQALNLKRTAEIGVAQQHELIEREKQQALREQQTNKLLGVLDRDNLMLSIQEQMARTAKERRQIQLDLLGNDIEARRLSARLLLASKDMADREAGRAMMDALPAYEEARKGQINRGTMGPLENYLDSIPKTAAEVNEAYENIAANGIQSMSDGLSDVVSKTLHLKGVAGQLFNQLISDLIRFQIQQATMKAVGGAQGGGGGIFGFLSGLFGQARIPGVGVGFSPSASLQSSSLSLINSGLPFFAKGGDMVVGGNSGIDRNVLSINDRPMARVSRGETISVNPSNDNRSGGIQVSVVKGDLFDVIVTRQAAGVVAAAAPALVSGSVNASQANMKRRATRSLLR